MNKKRTITLVLAALFVMSIFTSSVFACEEPPSCTPLKTQLLAGQHWTAGYVQIWNDGETLYVHYEVNDGWSLGETHLYVGTHPPTKAAPGRFPYHGGASYAVPLPDIDSTGRIYVAAHAVVYNGKQEETAWADTYGEFIRPGKGWALYVPYTPCYSVPPS